MGNFYTDVIRKDPRFRLPNLNKDLGLLEPAFRSRVLKFKEFAEHQGHVVTILETYRSPARQAALFKKGATQLKNVGVHGYGGAVDFALYINGKYDPNGHDYLCFAAIAKQAGVVSGIDWGDPSKRHTFQDFDHIQFCPVFLQADLFAQKWYPPENYDLMADLRAHGIK
jgi:hypothetical protein